jgi:tubulin beta
MGTEFQKVLCDEASGGIYVPRALLFDLEPGVTDAMRASPLGELFRPGNLVSRKRGKKWAKDHYRRAEIIFLTPHYKSAKH